MADRPVNEPTEEIEVTPDMVEAGYSASRLYDREDPKEWELTAVYRAMERARRQFTAADHRQGKRNPLV